MNPKEKAKELVNRFRKESKIPSKHYNKAKNFALICVEEIIQVTHSDKRANSTFDKEYWQHVKEEIQKL